MGTRLAPSYANIFMAEFENKNVYTYHQQPLWWKRFIDDIFMLWTHGEEDLMVFLNYLNTCHQTIKFTSHISTTEANFLDTTVKITGENEIITDLYEKPTDSHNYLHYTSCHPEHTKSSLPYSQFLRIKKICTKEEDFEKHSHKIYQHFVRREYPKRVLDKALSQVKAKNRLDLLQKNLETKDKEDKKLFSITTYNPNGNIAKKVIKSSWDLLSRSCATRPLYEQRIVFGLRRNKNLRDLLVKSTLPQEQNITVPLSQTQNTCAYKKCRYCPQIDITGSIMSSTRNRKFYTMVNVTCKSHNLIYCITCKTCKIQYVGQTKRRLMDRFQNHYYNIKKGVEQIGRHFNSHGHHGTEDIQIHILSFIRQPAESEASQTARNKIELAWIHRLNTIAPLGLNILD